MKKPLSFLPSKKPLQKNHPKGWFFFYGHTTFEVMVTEKRLSIFIRVVCFLFLLLIVRLFWLSVMQHEKLTQEAVAQRVSSAELVSVRGEITDRNGTPFTNRSEGEFAVYVDGADIEEGADAIAEQLGLSKEYVIHQIKNRTRLSFGPLNNLYPVERAGFLTLRAPLRQDENSVARHLIGTIDAQGVGNGGLEAAFESILNTGRKQSVISLRDVQKGLLGGRGYLEANRQVDDSHHLRLTLDYELQKELEVLAEKKLSKGCILVSDVETGDVLALVSRPQFDPNNLSASLNSTNGEFLNRALHGYNAGSVFKIVVAAAALEYGITVRDFCCNGVYQVADRTLSCYDYTAHGTVDLDEAFAQSCNGYFVRLAEKIGMERLLSMAKRLGMTEQATNLEQESRSILPDVTPALPGRLANLAIGQGELLTTPTAIHRLVDTVVHDGIQRTLNITDGVMDGQGLLIQSLRQTVEKRVLSGHTAQRLRQMMIKTVTEGTGKRAGNDEVQTAGKTGTAETGWIEDGELQVHAWFCGFLPTEEPRYCVTVFMENGQSGGTYAAPLFLEVSKILLNFFEKK